MVGTPIRIEDLAALHQLLDSETWAEFIQSKHNVEVHAYGTAGTVRFWDDSCVSIASGDDGVTLAPHLQEGFTGSFTAAEGFMQNVLGERVFWDDMLQTQMNSGTWQQHKRRDRLRQIVARECRGIEVAHLDGTTYWRLTMAHMEPVTVYITPPMRQTGMHVFDDRIPELNFAPLDLNDYTQVFPLLDANALSVLL